MHQDFYNVYAYCRWADDLGDEIGDRAESQRWLAWWRGELDAMYAGRATHPVFAALLPTVRKYGIPREDSKLRETTKGADDVLSQSITEIVVFRLSIQSQKWEYGDRRPRGGRRGLSWSALLG